LTIRLRQLTEQGLDEFQNYYSRISSGLAEDPPIDKLSIEPYSENFSHEIQIEDITFSTRLEMGRYLSNLFKDLPIGAFQYNQRMWTWLSLLWFNQLCPKDADGSRSKYLRESAKYFLSTDYRDYYRHFVAESWRIYHYFGDDDSKIFLTCEPYKHNDFIEQLASRQKLITIMGLVGTANKLYWDEKKGKPKKTQQTGRFLVI